MFGNFIYNLFGVDSAEQRKEKYSKEIIKLIDDMKEKMDNVPMTLATKDYSFDEFVIKTRKQVLTELKNKILKSE